MKKAFDQTFRDLKREVNKKVLKVPGIERKVLDATSNEAWGPHGSHLADIAQATRNYHEFQMIMVVIWKRINDTGKNWRHVYKALTVLEYLVAHGSERVIDEIREHAYQISTLSDFQYIDSSGRDQGSNVRRKSQSLVALVNSKERIQEVREKAAANKEKYRGGRTYRPDSHGHDDRFDDNHFEGRYRNRDEDRNGYERERDSGYDRYGRGGDSSSQDGDRYSRDFGERYRTDAYGDESYRGRGSDSYRFRSRSRSVDVDTDRSVDDDDRYSYRSGDTRADDHFQHERDGGTLKAPIDDTSSLAAPKATSSKDASQSRDPAVTGGSVAAEDNIVDAFDEFDLRASVAAAPLAASSQELDIFGSLSAPDCANSMPLATLPSGITSSEADTPINSGFGTNLVVPSTSSATVNQPVEDPFGDSPFKATQEDFPAQPQGFTPAPSFQPLGSAGGTETQQPIAPTLEAFSNFNFGDTLDGITYAPTAANSQHSSAGPTFLAAEFPNAQENSDILADILPPTGLAAQIPSQAVQHTATTATASAQMNFLPQSGGAVLPQMSFAAKIPTQAGQPAAPTTIDGAQMDFIPCPWLSTPEAAPVSSQAACFAAPASMQAAEPTAPTTRGAQMNFLPYSKLSTPQAVAISSQTAHFAAPTSMQTPQPTGPITTHGAQMSFHPYSELSTPQSAPAISQTAHFADPAITQTAQPAASSDILPFQSVASAPVASQAASTPLALPPVKAQPSKFQPKSAVWADTLSRGLIDLNISGPKVNPLADIGIDFETMNRREKRKEMKSSATPATSTITMGQAMGAGSGIGRAGAGGLAPPPNPTINPGLGMAMGMGVGGGTGMGMGVGMSMGGYGWGMNQLPVGMGMGMNMGMGMGVNMGMGQGAHARPPTGLPPGPGMPPAPGLSGIGYNPMMGMDNYGSQQPYGGGYG
ncbi:clathrin interactor EPSIN 2-like isoform X2 [Phoenix dactylifera]|uniref:Clathrin interactor EPSIN 2-like isoform X2 n=1 Tax=Phoenix dactylifera TaxID=42345 RepID=A0A8B8ZE04_PHODC|nr:clathrin interactor EPSIN 2-like isoform X2 [Phoenix dactylifera]